MPVNLRAELKKSIDIMLERGIIRHSTSEWALPIFLVRKKTGELRVCIDDRALNDATIKDAFPTPIIEDLVYQLYLMLTATTSIGRELQSSVGERRRPTKDRLCKRIGVFTNATLCLLV